MNSSAFENSKPNSHAFTRVELLALITCVGLLILVRLPSLGKSREGNHEAVCMNNLRQLGMALLMYSSENGDYVPEEGNTVNPINFPVNSDAWYNSAVRPQYPSLTNLYSSGAFPLPWNGTIYSCPSAPLPTFQPSFSMAFFMYAMNARICVNKATRASGASNTKLSTVPKPRDTFLMAEVDGNAAFGPAVSTVTGYYAIARHQGAGIFCMTDGHVRSAKTNEFKRTQSEANSSSVEWAMPRLLYWFPTPNTPD